MHMGYCLSCGKLRDTVNGWCQQCNEDEQQRKHPGWKPKRVVMKEQQNLREREEEASLI